MMRVSIDNGKTFVTPAKALAAVPLFQLADFMEGDVQQMVAEAYAPCSDEAFLHHYLELAHRDLIWTGQAQGTEKDTPPDYGTISTPRGTFVFRDMSRKEAEERGYGYHHTSEDGKYLIMADGMTAFAVLADRP